MCGLPVFDYFGNCGLTRKLAVLPVYDEPIADPPHCLHDVDTAAYGSL